MIEASLWSPHWTVCECAPQASERWGKVDCRHSHRWARLRRHEYDVRAWLARLGGGGVGWGLGECLGRRKAGDAVRRVQGMQVPRLKDGMGA
jgi:hypothetical protein